MRSFTIIIYPPNALCAPAHNRMPVIVDPTVYPASGGPRIGLSVDVTVNLSRVRR